jgi:prevent-host-death family protein
MKARKGTPAKANARTGSQPGSRKVTRPRGAARVPGDIARLASHVVSVAEAKRDFSELCSRAQYAHDTIVVTKRGRPVAALVGVRELERCLLIQDERAKRILERAIATSRGTVRVMPE